MFCLILLVGNYHGLHFLMSGETISFYFLLATISSVCSRAPISEQAADVAETDCSQGEEQSKEHNSDNRQPVFPDHVTEVSCISSPTLSLFRFDWKKWQSLSDFFSIAPPFCYPPPSPARPHLPFISRQNHLISVYFFLTFWSNCVGFCDERCATHILVRCRFSNHVLSFGDWNGGGVLERRKA